MRTLIRALRDAALWALALLVLSPLLVTLGGSLMGSAELLRHVDAILPGGTGYARAPLLTLHPTLVQYAMLLLDTPTFLAMFWNSAALVLPIVLGQALIGTLAAWGFARYRFPLRNSLFLLYIALMMMPFQVTLVPSFLTLEALRLLDTRWAVILPGAFGTFAVFLLRQFFQAVPDALAESARIDGAGELRIFARIGLPLCLPGVASLCALSFLENWNLIEQPMTFLRDPGRWPLSLYLTQIGQSNIDVAMGASVITLLPALLVFIYCESYLIRGIQMSGLKE